MTFRLLSVHQIKGDHALYVFAHVMWYSNFGIFYLLLYYRTGPSRVIRKFSSRSQSKTSWPPMNFMGRVSSWWNWID